MLVGFSEPLTASLIPPKNEGYFIRIPMAKLWMTGLLDQGMSLGLLNPSTNL